ncbi:MAG: deoxyguanosinetriphosphate triphosphohydrolase [Planctomycetota bacterium]
MLPTTPSPRPSDPGFATGTVTRREIEAREDAQLAPYAMRSQDSAGRVHDEPEHDYRTAYMRDRDRIIHASAFRKLEYKTQVFVNHEGDYYRTRLTHTMEVAQIARTAARALRLNEDLTESIALSHDLGHGPFGHKGEYVLQELMAEHGGFEHNEHGLRVVDHLELRYPRWRGLNLTYEVREAFARHSPRDLSAHGFPQGQQPLLEAQLVDVCDSLTYLAHDCDDGVTSGIVTTLDLCDVDLWRNHWQHVVRTEPELSHERKALLTVKRMIDHAVGDLVQSTWERITASGVTSPQAVRDQGGLLVGFSKDMHRMQRHLSHYLHEHFYCHPRLMKMGTKARRILMELFSAYQREPRMLDLVARAWVDEVGLERAICDRIASMSDREAQEEHARLFSPFERI